MYGMSGVLVSAETYVFHYSKNNRLSNVGVFNEKQINKNTSNSYLISVQIYPRYHCTLKLKA